MIRAMCAQPAALFWRQLARHALPGAYFPDIHGPHGKALLRLYQVSIKAVSRLSQGEIKALQDEPCCGVAG